MKTTCRQCKCFRKENHDPDTDIIVGICICHGYHVMSNEESCIDYEE